MEHPKHTVFAGATSVAQTLTTEEYVRFVHPLGSIGKPTLLVKQRSEEKRRSFNVSSKTRTLEDAPFWANCLRGHDACVSLHCFHGPRCNSNLASLNGLFLDLGYALTPEDLRRDRAFWALRVTADCAARGLPDPSFKMFAGRGLAALWLINPLPPAAERRWRAVQGALIDLFRNRGADPSCKDPSRVTRLPGSINSKNDRAAAILTGTCLRHDFDDLAGRIFVAAGRPTRSQLKERARDKPNRARHEGRTGGMSPISRFSAILRDLDRLCQSWGGAAPEGRRHAWLHLYATCRCPRSKRSCGPQNVRPSTGPRVFQAWSDNRGPVGCLRRRRSAPWAGTSLLGA